MTQNDPLTYFKVDELAEVAAGTRRPEDVAPVPPMEQRLLVDRFIEGVRPTKAEAVKRWVMRLFHIWRLVWTQSRRGPRPFGRLKTLWTLVRYTKFYIQGRVS